MSYPIKVDVGDDSIPPDLNYTGHILYVYQKTLLKQWADNSIPSWAPLDVNATLRRLIFQLGPNSWVMSDPIKVDVGDDAIPSDLNHICQYFKLGPES